MCGIAATDTAIIYNVAKCTSIWLHAAHWKALLLTGINYSLLLLLLLVLIVVVCAECLCECYVHCYTTGRITPDVSAYFVI